MPHQTNSGDDVTVQILRGERGQLALVLYRLRASSHRIAADCERLFAELDRPSRQAWQTAVGKALLASRQLKSLIEHEGGKVETPDTLKALQHGIARPQQEIVDAMSGLLALIPTDGEEELIMRDAAAIRDAAIGLLTTDHHPGPSTPAVRAPATPGTDDTSADGKPARVLVVDDEESLRRTLGRMLQHLGYDVMMAENGRAALEMAEREPPDLVITDLSMPDVDGHQLLARLKAGEATRHIPVIIVSGEGDTKSVVRCIEQGAEDHLTKPYELIVLQARIRASLERKRMRDVELAHLRRVAQLTAAAEAVERQTYESRLLEDLVAKPDSLGQLARVFDRMVSGIRSREEQLEFRVRQLRREISETTPTPASETVSEESPFAVGQAIADRYEIKRELGKGGMGMVYLARDRELNEDVAVKVVRHDLLGQDPNLLERLKSEIRLARKISHRNVVRSHDFGEWQGVYFITMEYIKGVSVADLIATRGRLTVPSTLAIGSQLADALAVAHGEHIIHRDIKPMNLLIDEAGVLKVMDFGLARPVTRTGELTQAGYVVGTPRYMAPEQILGGEVDARTDLFSTGIVLYECLTGRAPFEASNPIAVVARMLEGPPPPVRDLVPTIPLALAAIVDKLLQREPMNRFSSARDLAEQLSQVSQFTS